MYYTHIACSGHAVPTQCPPTLCKYMKMCVITRMWLHAVDVTLHVKLHAVIQLELINCM